MPASYYLDPPNKAFNDAVSKGPGLYTKTPQEAREIVEGLQKHDPASDIAVEEIKVPAAGGEVTTVIFRPAESAHRALPVVFYTHGGGWILGSPTVHGSLMEDLARQSGAAVVFPYYTPAPEAQYPTQFEQSYGVLEYILKNGQKHKLMVEQVALAGDSVGGQMAIALTQLAEQRNLNIKIAHFVLFYPLVITEIPKRTQTYTTYHDGPYLLVDTLDWMIDAFLPNQEDRKNSLTSPLWYASKETLAKFPPTTIFVSGADPLVDEGLLFGQRLQEAGVECVIIQAYGQIHDYVMLEATRKSATAKAVVELAALKLKNALWE